MNSPRSLTTTLLAVALGVACQAKVEKTEVSAEPPPTTTATNDAKATPSAGAGASGGAATGAGGASGGAGSGSGGGTASGGAASAGGEAGAGGVRIITWEEEREYVLDAEGNVIPCGALANPAVIGHIDQTSCGAGGYCWYQADGSCYLRGGGDPRSQGTNGGSCVRRPEHCPPECFGARGRDPGVCGCDGREYCNECLAKQAGVDIERGRWPCEGTR